MRILYLFLISGGFVLFPFTIQASTLITSPGPGGGPHIRAFSADGTVQAEPDKLFAYAEDYRGGVRVSTGDIDTDNQDEIIVGTGENGGPHLRVFEKDGTPRGIEFFPFHPDFRGGMDVASGDFDGDGKDDIAVTQFSNGQAWVKVYKYNSERTILFEKNVFGNPECGATVAMGQLDSDASKELIVGAGTGCDPYVYVFDYNSSNREGTRKPIYLYASTPPVRSGVDVSAGDVDGDGKDEVAVSRLKNDYSWVKVFRYNNEQTELSSFKAYGDYLTGANVEMYDVDGDQKAEVITGAGSTGGPQVRAFEYDGTPIATTNFMAYDASFRGGADVAGFQSAESIDSDEGDYPWHNNIFMTLFSVTAGGVTASTFDHHWKEHYGGEDHLYDRDGYYPRGFTPKENPFYVALPYNDFKLAGHKDKVKEIPWYDEQYLDTGFSFCKNQWIQIAYEGKTCYAQWEDCGPVSPGITPCDDFEYVFEAGEPAHKYGLDASPAVHTCLDLDDPNGYVSWRFIAQDDVPAGPWKDIITTSWPDYSALELNPLDFNKYKLIFGG